jgi:hypothetical protein
MAPTGRKPYLELVTLGYLLLPYFLFAVGWLPWAGAALAWAALLLAFRSCARCWALPGDLETEAPAGSAREKWAIGLAALIVALAWVGVSGAGGCGLQRGDWIKHNAVLRDLILRPWPVLFWATRLGPLWVPEPAGGPADLVAAVRQLLGEPGAAVPLTPYCLSYSTAYYLPAALLGKALGWKAANAGLFLWTAAGVWLTLLWLARLLPRAGPRAVAAALLAFPLLSGLDTLGEQLVSGHFRDWGLAHKEWWSGFWQYSSNTTLLVQTPQHALPGWLVAGMFLDGALRGRGVGGHLFLLALSALWSPFALVGLAPLAALALAQRRGAGLVSFANLVAAPAIIVLVGLHFAGRAGAIPGGFLWQVETPPGFPLVSRLLLFDALEFGLYGALLAAAGGLARGPLRAWGWLALASLTALPLYRMGLFSDLTMRGSVPALFVLWVCLLRCLLTPVRTAWARVGWLALAGALAVGATWPVYDLAQSVRLFRVWPRPLACVYDVMGFPKVIHGGIADTLYQQYLVPRATPFARLSDLRSAPRPGEVPGGPTLLLLGENGLPLSPGARPAFLLASSDAPPFEAPEAHCLAPLFARFHPERPHIVQFENANWGVEKHPDGRRCTWLGTQETTLHLWSPRAGSAALCLAGDPGPSLPGTPARRLRFCPPGGPAQEVRVSGPFTLRLPFDVPAGGSTVRLRCLDRPEKLFPELGAGPNLALLVYLKEVRLVLTDDPRAGARPAGQP